MERKKITEQDELKILTKGKSPEEIVKIVEDYYQAKYKEEQIFTKRPFIIMLIIFLILIFLLVSLYRVLSSSKIQKKEETSKSFFHKNYPVKDKNVV